MCGLVFRAFCESDLLFVYAGKLRGEWLFYMLANAMNVTR